tara:strand:- start:2082 stop:4061 length:1980 start_codon:yes stop_codon:yes gene_type:complete
MKIIEGKENIKWVKIIGITMVLVLTLLVYSNHFNNPFFFDDSHTIVTNGAITQISNWSSFFKDATTFSSLPANRAYRPMMTLMNAIDFNIGGGLNAKYFHIHIFFWYLVTIILFFILCNSLFLKAINDPSKKFAIIIVSLFTTLYFATHTINAETINYICARSDSFSTLCVIVSLLLFINQKSRKYHLYLLSMIIGIWSKQTAVMFIPILFFYLIIFEKETYFEHIKNDVKNWFLAVFKMMIVPSIIAFLLFAFNHFYLTPSSTVSSNTEVKQLDYILTQFYVVLHYFGNFLLPTSLSADPDIEILKPWYDKRILLGLLFSSSLIFAAFKAAKNLNTRPIAFGIAWFFIALLPTSIVPLYQIANDHRMFFPFVGIFIAIPWAIYLFLISNQKKSLKYISVFVCLILIGAYANGTYQRNKVWGDAETLWKDVTIKSPKNGRGQMNYGLALMSKGDYSNAKEYFIEAEKKAPYWYAVKINLAILNGAIGNKDLAEQYFTNAINLNASAPDPEYYYARYLYDNGQNKKALDFVNTALTKSPNHLKSNELKQKLASIIKPSTNTISALKKQLGLTPNNINLLIELSNQLYIEKNYDEALIYCYRVIKLDSNNKLAFNNLCSCLNQKKQWVKAISACEKALIIDSNFQIAKNNLNWALQGLKNQ